MSGWTRRAATAAIIVSGLAPRAGLTSVATASPLLWSARGAVGSAILFGQMPVRADTAWQTPRIQAAFESSGTLWLENPVFSREEAEALIAQREVKPRPTAAEFLPWDDLNRLRDQLARAGASRNAFDALPADDIFQRLSAMADAKSSADFSRLPERILREEAVKSGKPIVTEWQSLKEVAGFIPPAPDPVRLQLIRLGLDDLDVAWQVDERLRAWTGGDALYFDRIGAMIAHRYPELTAKMNGERNSRLAARLATAMESPGQHFVCVGIRHVTGPDSIQNFLARGGVAVDRADTAHRA